MKVKMSIDECIEFADEWSRGMTIHEGSQGWRVACMLLANEVRLLRGERFVFAQLLDAAAQVMHTLDGEEADEENQLRALQERLERAALDARGFASVPEVGAGRTATLGHNVKVTGSPVLSASPRGLPGSDPDEGTTWK